MEVSEVQAFFVLDRVYLRGNTYPLKEELKKRGFKWTGETWTKALRGNEERGKIIEELKALGIKVLEGGDLDVRFCELEEHGKAILRILEELAEMLDTSRPGPGRFKSVEDMSEAERKAFDLSKVLTQLATDFGGKFLLISRLREQVKKLKEV